MKLLECLIYRVSIICVGCKVDENYCEVIMMIQGVSRSAVEDS